MSMQFFVLCILHDWKFSVLIKMLYKYFSCIWTGGTIMNWLANLKCQGAFSKLALY